MKKEEKTLPSIANVDLMVLLANEGSGESVLLIPTPKGDDYISRRYFHWELRLLPYLQERFNQGTPKKPKGITVFELEQTLKDEHESMLLDITENVQAYQRTLQRFKRHGVVNIVKGENELGDKVIEGYNYRTTKVALMLNNEGRVVTFTTKARKQSE